MTDHRCPPLDRRQMLRNSTGSFLSLAVAGMLADEAGAKSLEQAGAHRPPRAKSVIYLYMEGGPSQIDTFDPKPRLDRDHGQDLPLKTPNTVFDIGKKILRSPYKFQQYGQSGAWVSEIFPNVAKCVDDLTIIRSMNHDFSSHTSACYMTHTGHALAGRPCFGAWVNYGLGSTSKNLPGFVVLNCGMGPSGGPPSWGSGFLPAAYQGTVFGKTETPVDFVQPLETAPEQQPQKLYALQALNGLRAGEFRDSRLEAVIQNYELAFQMQTAVPELNDFQDESASTRTLYGLDQPETALYGSRCLMARRLVERGVRFIEVFSPSLDTDRWDQHSDLQRGHRLNAQATDAPIAGLIIDLKQRGLLDETLVVWGGEFGRTPNAQGTDGRDHNPFGYTMWVAGGGFKPGIRYGATDEFGYFAQQDKVHLHDLHATLLHQLGIDHKRLTFRYQGRDFRLTDVAGEVITRLLS
jgi:hypothetical protein